MRRLVLVALALASVTTGCATTTKPLAAPTVDVSGQWAGSWSGYGIANIPRKEPASLQITQAGGTAPNPGPGRPMSACRSGYRSRCRRPTPGRRRL